MAPSNDEAPHDEPTSAAQDDARLFYERLEQVGQLVNVEANADVAALPAHVTHVRYPDGTVNRIRFTTSLYRQT
jgi:hypothetical protein